MGFKPTTGNRQEEIETLVRQYRLYNLPDAQTERIFFKDMPSLELCIHHAALAIDHRGKRYSHQRRLSRMSLEKAKERLNSAHQLISACQTFHDLFLAVAGLVEDVPGIGKLFVYDAALRIGGYLSLAPTAVYLHAGTSAGARALGLEPGSEHIAVTDLPSALQTLAPDEIESLLCIYKDRLAAARNKQYFHG